MSLHGTCAADVANSRMLRGCGAASRVSGAQRGAKALRRGGVQRPVRTARFVGQCRGRRTGEGTLMAVFARHVCAFGLITYISASEELVGVCMLLCTGRV
jgi:hypothetical protein